MKHCFIDVETTGLFPSKHGILQLAGKIFINGKLEESFNYHCQPFPDDVLDLKALQVTGFDKEDIDSWEDPTQTFNKFKALLKKYVDPFNKTDKYFFVAYNAGFDSDHLRAWFRKNSDRYFGSWFWTPALDVMIMAGVALEEERASMPNFKLETVAKQLGFEVDSEQTHDALYDIDLTVKMYRKLRGEFVKVDE